MRYLLKTVMLSEDTAEAALLQSSELALRQSQFDRAQRNCSYRLYNLVPYRGAGAAPSSFRKSRTSP